MTEYFEKRITDRVLTQAPNSRLLFLAILFGMSRTNSDVDPEIAEFDRRQRKALKWAIKKRFVTMSIGRDVTITQKGIAHLRKKAPSMYSNIMAVSPNSLKEVLNDEDVITVEEWGNQEMMR